MRRNHPVPAAVNRLHRSTRTAHSGFNLR